MIYNVFAFRPNHYDRGSHIFLGRIVSSIPFPVARLAKVENAIDYNLGFYNDSDVVEVEAEEIERIGGSIFNKDATIILGTPPLVADTVDDFMNVVRTFVEDYDLDIDDDVLDAAFIDEVVDSAEKSIDETDTTKGKVKPTYPKVKFKPRKKDYGYRVKVDKLSSTVFMAEAERSVYDEARGDMAEAFVPERVVRKVTEERLGKLTWEAIPRVVRHAPNSPFEGKFWVLRSDRFKNIDFVATDKRSAKIALRTYVATIDNQ